MNYEDVKNDKYDEVQLCDYLRKNQPRKSKAALEQYLMEATYDDLKNDAMILIARGE